MRYSFLLFIAVVSVAFSNQIEKFETDKFNNLQKTAIHLQSGTLLVGFMGGI